MRIPAWLGVRERRWKKSPDEEVQPSKTVWDWLQLLIVPAFLVGAVTFYNSSQTAQQNRRSVQAAQDATLDAYFLQMSDLMLKDNLVHAVSGSAVRAVADAITGAAISRLDATRQVEVARFLSDANLTGANLASADFNDANLEGVALRNADLTNASFTHADLLGANLRGTNLTYADMVGAYLDGANLSDGRLTYADLTNAKLREAHLRRADLNGANLTDADLRGADLRDAGIGGPSQTDLRGADLEGANLAGAYLGGADLAGADLAGAIFENTTCPNGKITNTKC